MPLLIGDSQFGNAPQRQRADSLELIGVNRRGVVAAVVEGEDPAADRFEVNDVGPSFGLDLAQRLESLRVKSRHARVTAVAGESSVQVGNECDAVHARRAGNLADHLLAFEIQDNHVRASRDEKSWEAGSTSRKSHPPSPPIASLRTFS